MEISNEVFLRAVFGDQWERAYVVAFLGDPSAGGDRSRWAGNTAERVLHTFRDDENQYWTVSLFNTDYSDRASGRATRRKSMFAQMNAVVVDDVALNDELGGGKKVLESVVLAKMGEPSARLQTSPGNCQFIYVLEPPITDRVIAEALVNEMIARGLSTDGTDPGMKGVTRLVRLPGGTNRKAKYGATGFKCRMLSWNPGAMFTAEQIASAWGIDLAAAKRAADEMARPRATEKVDGPVIAWDRDTMARLFLPEDHEHAAVFPPADLEFVRGKGEDDPLLKGLARLRLVKERTGADQFEITCPFVHSHTNRANNGTAYMPGGGISCHHGHCVGRTRAEYAMEVAKRLRRATDKQTLALADEIDPPRKFARKFARRTSGDWMSDVMDVRKTLIGARKLAGFNARSAMAREALKVAPWIDSGEVEERRVLDLTVSMCEDIGQPLAAWQSAIRWALAVVRSEKEA